MVSSNFSLLLRYLSRSISSPSLLLLLCVGLACLPGCGDEEPADSEPSTETGTAVDIGEDAAPSPDTADTSPSSDTVDGGEQDTLEDAEQDAPDAENGLRATSIVGPSGATLTLESGVSLTIPAGALDAEIEVQIREVGPLAVPALEGLELFSPAIALLPHGTTFNAPVTLTLPHDGFDGFGGFAMRLEDELDLDFEEVEVSEYGELSVTLELESFSIYLVRSGCDRLCTEAVVSLCGGGIPLINECRRDCNDSRTGASPSEATACEQYSNGLLNCYLDGLEASGIDCSTGQLGFSGCSELETTAASCSTCFAAGNATVAEAESCTMCASFGYTTPEELVECRALCLGTDEEMAACNACNALVENLSEMGTSYTLTNLELCVDRYINHCHRDGVPFWDPIFNGSPPDPDIGLARCLQCGPADVDADGCPNLCDFSDTNNYCVGPLDCRSTMVVPPIAFDLYAVPDIDLCAPPTSDQCPGEVCNATCEPPCDNPLQDGYFLYQSCNCSTPICGCNTSDCLTALGEQCVPGFP